MESGTLWKKITVEKKEKKKPALDLRPSHVSVLAFFHWDSGGFINAFGRLKKDKIKILLCASTLAVNRIRQPQSNKQTGKHQQLVRYKLMWFQNTITLKS